MFYALSLGMDLKSLIGKLNATCHRTLEEAAGLCVSRTHYQIEPEHWWARLVDSSSSDVTRVLEWFELDVGRLARDITRTMDTLKTGNARTPAFSSTIPQWVARAWLVASLEFHVGKIRSLHLLLAALEDPELRRSLEMASKEFSKLSGEQIRQHVAAISKTSSENDELLEIPDTPDPKAFRIFICYRREDWALAGRIYESLSREFGEEHVFRDLQSIKTGADWTKSIDEQLEACSVFLAVLGSGWRTKTGLRKLNRPDDYVRYELARALARQIPVVPILVDRTKIPAADQLPEDLQELTKRQAIQVGDTTLNESLSRLTAALKSLAAQRAPWV